MWQAYQHDIQVMGILNATPDSFSDGGQFNQLDKALRHAEQMIADGVNIIDIGGESTRPGAAAVSVEQELARVMPIIEAIQQRFAIALSIDTSKPIVMQAAVTAGVAMINDVRALQEPSALAVCAPLNVPICLMHMQGLPRTMQQQPTYHDVLTEVTQFFQERIKACVQAGIQPERLLLDPGFGFGKKLNHNLDLLLNLNALNRLGLPLLVGVSRKSMIGQLSANISAAQRDEASALVGLLAIYQGARILRVHNVKQTVAALNVFKQALQA
jgi:dihydropteroate synthase